MATPIEMPMLGNTVEECLLAGWCKQVGDEVAKGELLAEIETDKATFELTSPVAGTLLEIFFNEGDLVPVFSNVCVIGKPGESVEAFRPPKTSPPPAVQPRHEKRLDKDGEILSAQSEPAVVEVGAGPARNFLSPRARRFAQEHDCHPERIEGTGPGGRIIEEDLRRLYYGSEGKSSLAAKLVKEGHEHMRGRILSDGRILSSDLVQPPEKISYFRERIAGRMRNSLATTAQYTMNTSAEATGLLALRRRIKSRQEEKNLPSIDINEMVIFCVVRALELVPEINVEFVDGKLYRHSSINIGFACDTSKGLLVPVVRDSQKLTLPELALKIKELAQQAQEGTIAPEDLSGGTFTVSNLGAYGIESFSPILNPPQAAILGVNSIELRPVRRGATVQFIDYIGLSLTCDHQVIDGAPGASFLKVVREQIETVENIAGLDLAVK
jgi:pyruvate dehydrogenase E2 component (dihydrolipoamide acetyltransferase)